MWVCSTVHNYGYIKKTWAADKIFEVTKGFITGKISKTFGGSSYLYKQC